MLNFRIENPYLIPLDKVQSKQELYVDLIFYGLDSSYLALSRVPLSELVESMIETINGLSENAANSSLEVEVAVMADMDSDDMILLKKICETKYRLEVSPIGQYCDLDSKEALIGVFVQLLQDAAKVATDVGPTQYKRVSDAVVGILDPSIRQKVI